MVLQPIFCDRRFEEGFDPGLSISADPQELTLPMGLLLLARLHGRPIGCGALKFHQRRPAELKKCGSRQLRVDSV